MKLLKIIPFLIFLLPACDFNPNEKVVPAWEMEIFGPLVKADLNIQNISELEDLEAKGEIAPSAFGIGVTGAVPATPAPGISSPSVPVDLTDAFSSAVFETGELSFKITNEMQINIQSATIEFRSGATAIISQPITNIPAGGTYTSPITNLSNATIVSPLNLRVLNYRTSGGNITDLSKKIIVEVFLRNVKVKSITVTAAEDFSITDTSDFSISGNKIESESVGGIFNTYITNSFPMDLQFQIYFTDASKTVVLDSLFDGGDQTISAGAGEKKFVTTINSVKLSNLNKAEFARIGLKLSAPPSGTIIIQDNIFVKAQVVGDLKVKLSEE